MNHDRRPREARIDFFRGIALWVIYTDHVRGNLLSEFTLLKLGVSDMAEAFVFVSGLACGLSYRRRLQRDGLRPCALRAWTRAFQLYVALILALSSTAGMWIALWTGAGIEPWNEALRTTCVRVYADPLGMFFEWITLQGHVGHAGVLSLYVILMLAFPAFLGIHRRSPSLACAASASLYLAVQLVQATGQADDGWLNNFYFSPPAWQLLFVVGFLLSGDSEVPRWSTRSVPVALSFVIVEVVLLCALLSPDFQVPWSRKQTLGPARLVYFAALAILVCRFCPSSARLATWLWVKPLLVCGRNPLTTFSASIVLDSLGTEMLARWPDRLVAHGAVNVGGWILLTLIATGSEAMLRKPNPGYVRPGSGQDDVHVRMNS